MTMPNLEQMNPKSVEYRIEWARQAVNYMPDSARKLEAMRWFNSVRKIQDDTDLPEDRRSILLDWALNEVENLYSGR